LLKILIVRLGAMGDILHTMPAVAALRASQPDAEIAWVLEPKWFPLLECSGLAHHLLPLDRRSAISIWTAQRWLKRWRPDIAIDFQGLLKSALVARCSAAPQRRGFANGLREEAAGLFYTDPIASSATHVVDKNCDLVGLPAAPPLLPQGQAGETLPAGPFVLAAPFAGWASKQWPIERYAQLAALLQDRHAVTLVLNVAPNQATPNGVFRHQSDIGGLIHATRQAHAVLGLDSGPLHLAAALGKPGVALFGPTDPARNGPYRSPITVLRQPNAETTYKRGAQIAPSMMSLSVEAVYNALAPHLP
jgi:heptosyltransferase I